MDSAGSTPSLQTERLALRPLAAEDLEVLHRISNEPDVRRHLWDDEPVPEAEILDLIAGSTRMFSGENLGLFGVRLRGDAHLLGFCGFVRLGGMDEPELGYELTRDVWERGYATEASLACLRHAFEAAGLKRVIAGADPPNVASLRVLEKLDMKPLGNINPNAPDEPYYVLYRREFLVPDQRRGPGQSN